MMADLRLQARPDPSAVVHDLGSDERPHAHEPHLGNDLLQVPVDGCVEQVLFQGLGPVWVVFGDPSRYAPRRQEGRHLVHHDEERRELLGRWELVPADGACSSERLGPLLPLLIDEPESRHGFGERPAAPAAWADEGLAPQVVHTF